MAKRIARHLGLDQLPPAPRRVPPHHHPYARLSSQAVVRRRAQIRRRIRRHGKRGLDPGAHFALVKARAHVALETDEEAERPHTIMVRQEPGDRGAQVAKLGVDASEPARLVAGYAMQMQLRCFGEGQEERGMTFPRPRPLHRARRAARARTRGSSPAS